MNRIIRNLFIQAGGGVEEENGNLWTYSEDLDPELFAQLVVRKCISEVAMMGVVQYENEDIAWAVNMIIGNLKETFEIKNMTTGKSGTSGAPESFGKERL